MEKTPIDNSLITKIEDVARGLWHEQKRPEPSAALILKALVQVMEAQGTPVNIEVVYIRPYSERWNK